MKFYKEVYKETLSPDVRDYGDHLVLAGSSIGFLTVSEMRIYPNDVAQRFLVDCSESINWSSLDVEDDMDIEEVLDTIVKERMDDINVQVGKITDLLYNKKTYGDNTVNRNLTTIVVKERLYKALTEMSNWLIKEYHDTPDSVFVMDDKKINEYFDTLINKQIHKTCPQKFNSRPAIDVLCPPTLKEHEKVAIEVDVPRSNARNDAK